MPKTPRIVNHSRTSFLNVIHDFSTLSFLVAVLSVGRQDTLGMQGVELRETTCSTDPCAHRLRFLTLDDESNLVGVNDRLKFPLHRRTDMHFSDNVR